MTPNSHRPFVRRPSIFTFLLLALLLAGAASLIVSRALAAPPTVLILSSTVTGGAASEEAQAAIALGYNVDVVTPAQWATKTQADFASYRALILGDATCTDISVITAAEANASVWGPAVNGNVIIQGSPGFP